MDKELMYEERLIRDFGHLVYGKWQKVDHAIYIGRGSIYGNPFPMQNQTHEERLRVCLAYRQYASKRIAKDPEFAEAVKALYGKKVMCFCSNGTRSKKDGARFCHGHVLQAAAKYLVEKP